MLVPCRIPSCVKVPPVKVFDSNSSISPSSSGLETDAIFTVRYPKSEIAPGLEKPTRPTLTFSAIFLSFWIVLIKLVTPLCTAPTRSLPPFTDEFIEPDISTTRTMSIGFDFICLLPLTFR